MKTNRKIVCKNCGRTPDKIEEYLFAAKEYDMTPEEYIPSFEGTYNERTKKFYCTSCYIKVGMPLGTA